jgi:hypothetical protein
VERRPAMLIICLAFIVAATILEIKGFPPYDQILFSLVFGALSFIKEK